MYVCMYVCIYVRMHVCTYVCMYVCMYVCHLLDYIITRKDCNIISDFLVSDFISDHRALHASLQCIRPHLFGNRYQSEQLGE